MFRIVASPYQPGRQKRRLFRQVLQTTSTIGRTSSDRNPGSAYSSRSTSRGKVR